MIPLNIVFYDIFPKEIVALIIKFYFKTKPILLLQYFDLMDIFYIHEKRELIVDCLNINFKITNVPFFNYILTSLEYINTDYFLNVASIVKDLFSNEIFYKSCFHNHKNGMINVKPFLNLKFIKCLYESTFDIFTNNLCTFLCILSVDYSKTCKWYIDSFENYYYINLSILSIRRNDLETLKLLCLDKLLDPIFYCYAIVCNNLEIVKWLYDNNCEWKHRAYDRIISKYPEIENFLNENKLEYFKY
jgi:hypothetical protein